MYPPKNGQTHRFGDAVAVSIGKGETVYMTPAMARAVAKSLNAIARSIRREKFGASPNSLTASFKFDDARNDEFQVRRK